MSTQNPLEAMARNMASKLAAADAQQNLIEHAAARGHFLPAARFPRYVVVKPGLNRAQRRAAASPRPRPAPSTPQSRAIAAEFRIRALRARQEAARG